MAKMVEVDEEELRSNRELRQVVSKIYADPKARLLVQEATKMIDPNARTPELDAVRSRNEVVEPVTKELAELKKQLADEKAAAENDRKLAALTAKIESGFDKLRREHRLTDEGVTAVRKLMDEEGITNPEIAWAALERQHPPQDLVSPNGPGSGSWNFLETPSGDADADIKKLIESRGDGPGADLITGKLARDALNEMRNQPRR